MELNQKTLKKAYSYLSKDKCMQYLILKFSNQIDISERYNEDLPYALSCLVIEQQVSFKAAITIKKRFFKKINHLTNDEILEMGLNELKSIGISYKKAEYIKNVYKYFKTSNFDFDSASNDEVISDLTRIKGIGLVVSGIVQDGIINVNDKLMMGPFNGKFKEVLVRSIHNNFRQSVESLKSGQGGCINIKCISMY